VPNKEEKKFIFRGAIAGAVLGCVFFIWPFKALRNSPIADPIIGPDGKVAGKYRKVCLPRGEIEGGLKPGTLYPVVEKAIRKNLHIWQGHLTEADLEKVTELNLSFKKLISVEGLENLTQLKELQLANNKLTEVPKGLEKLTKLETLYLDSNKLTDVTGLENLTELKKLFLDYNPDLTKAQIAELKKALPKCKIESNPTK